MPSSVMESPSSRVTYRAGAVPKKNRRMQQTKATKTAYGVQVVGRSLTWPLVKERIFCDLPKSMLAELDGISSPSTYSRILSFSAQGRTLAVSLSFATVA
jgi:hypothetical protein